MEQELNMMTAKHQQQSAQYRDYAEEVNTEVDDGNTNGDITLMQEPPPALFPEILFQMLQHIDLYEPDLANIVSWQPHGRSFVVQDTKRFEQLVIPAFFKQTKLYSSFRRQLKLWGFSRLLAQQQKKRAPEKADCAVYYHELFLRSKAHLHHRIRRKCCIIAKSFHFSGAGGGAACEEQQQEPDFNTMTILPPSASSL